MKPINFNLLFGLFFGMSAVLIRTKFQLMLMIISSHPWY